MKVKSLRWSPLSNRAFWLKSSDAEEIPSNFNNSWSPQMPQVSASTSWQFTHRLIFSLRLKHLEASLVFSRSRRTTRSTGLKNNNKNNATSCQPYPSLWSSFSVPPCECYQPLNVHWPPHHSCRNLQNPVLHQLGELPLEGIQRGGHLLHKLSYDVLESDKPHVVSTVKEITQTCYKHVFNLLFLLKF